MAATPSADKAESFTNKPENEDRCKYKKPVLRKYGDLRSLTLGISGDKFDADLQSFYY